MAMFYASIKGSRGMATRLGTKNSGMNVVSATWKGSIRIDTWEDNGILHYAIHKAPWHDAGESRLIEEGTF